MTTHRDNELEEELAPLPSEVAEDLAALRAMDAPADVTARAFARIREPAAPPRPSAKPARRRFVAGLTVAASACALLVLSLVNLQPRADEIALALPSEGSGYIHLPWNLHEQDGAATMKVETHAQLAALHPAPDSSQCGEERCIHEWNIDPKAGGLRVAIPGPGRWHFDVRHTKNGSEVTKRFVVVATRD